MRFCGSFDVVPLIPVLSRLASSINLFCGATLDPIRYKSQYIVRLVHQLDDLHLSETYFQAQIRNSEEVIRVFLPQTQKKSIQLESSIV